MALPLALLAAAAAPPATPDNLADILAQPCRPPGDAPAMRKVAQVMIGSYVNGYAEAVAAGCDARSAAGPCRRLLARQVDGGRLLMPSVAATYDRLCGPGSRLTLRDVAARIVAAAGFKDDDDDAPRAKGR